jgi:hypothetical protein
VAAALPLRPVGALNGFGEAAALLTNAAPPGQPVVALVAADGPGEGAFVVAMAARDARRPRHTVWRGTKLLARVTWAGRDYGLRTDTDSGVVALLERASVTAVVLARSPVPFPHQHPLARAIAARPDRFVLRRVLPLVREGTRSGEGLAIYDVVRRGAPATAPTLSQSPGYEGIRTLGPTPTRSAPPLTRSAPPS